MGRCSPIGVQPGPCRILIGKGFFNGARSLTPLATPGGIDALPISDGKPAVVVAHYDRVIARVRLQHGVPV